MNRLTIAIEALWACAELGMNVPDDIAVVACDDIMVAGLLSPALITLRAPKYDIGARSAMMLLDRIRGCSGTARSCSSPSDRPRERAANR